MKYDYIIVGAGLAGASLASLLAQKNNKVLVIEKRDHIAGNAYDYKQDGILIHKYGPHIFHTNDLEVLEFLKNYTEFYDYKHKVLGHIDDKLQVPIPFNLKSLELCFGNSSEIKEELFKYFKYDERVTIHDLLEHENLTLKNLGEFIFEKIFKFYTMKQWGLKASELDLSILKRVPITLSYNDYYFNDKYQMMPLNGYTAMVKKMLDHPNIDLILNKDALSDLKLDAGKIYYQDKLYEGRLIFTGQIDELFNFTFGKLNYRSLEFDLKYYDQTFQKYATENYPQAKNIIPYTRISEYKHLMKDCNKKHSYVHVEYPKDYNYDDQDIPYYPIINENNLAIYNKYLELNKDYPNLYLIGRLAQYRYYNMDAIIKEAINLSKKL